MTTETRQTSLKIKAPTRMYPKASLAALPQELLDMIWRWVFEDATDSAGYHILLTCRKLYHSASVVAFKIGTSTLRASLFRHTDEEMDAKIKRALTTARRSLIHSIIIPWKLDVAIKPADVIDLLRRNKISPEVMAVPTYGTLREFMPVLFSSRSRPSGLKLLIGRSETIKEVKYHAVAAIYEAMEHELGVYHPHLVGEEKYTKLTEGVKSTLRKHVGMEITFRADWMMDLGPEITRLTVRVEYARPMKMITERDVEYITRRMEPRLQTCDKAHDRFASLSARRRAALRQ